MTNEQREVHRKKRVLEHAERMGNVNKTCRYFGVTTGLGKGFADTDNPSQSMQFASGDLGTGIVLDFSTSGFKHFERDSIGFSVSYEYNFDQKEISLSFDVSFGWSF